MSLVSGDIPTSQSRCGSNASDLVLPKDMRIRASVHWRIVSMRWDRGCQRGIGDWVIQT